MVQRLRDESRSRLSPINSAGRAVKTWPLLRPVIVLALARALAITCFSVKVAARWVRKLFAQKRFKPIELGFWVFNPQPALAGFARNSLELQYFEGSTKGAWCVLARP